MTKDELLAKFANDRESFRNWSVSKILRHMHSLNNIECKIGNPEWYTFSLTKLRRMMSKISDDLNLTSCEIYQMSKERILKILFSLDVMFQCYTHSFEYCIHDKNRLINDTEIQKKFIYLGATMGKDFSYLIDFNSITLRSCIENKYFGKFTDMNNLTRYALAYENFENENKYECMLKQLRQRQIFQEQQLQEIRRQIYESQIQLNYEIDEIEIVPTPFSNPLQQTEDTRNYKRKNNFSRLMKWLLKLNPMVKKNDELIVDASCSVCYVSKKNILFTECGHISACSSCSEKLGFKCPMCRKMSDSKMLVFY